MPNTILTPVTLWKDFDDSLPCLEEVLSCRKYGSTVCREVYILGRQTVYGRVKIYGRLYSPAGQKSYPVVLTMFEAGFDEDAKFIRHLLDRGYGVFCPDYRGEAGEGRHTIYPRDVDYANVARAGRHMTHVDETAKETSWYEWAAVVRYAMKYLGEHKEVTRVGMVGFRTGGEILWKVAPFVSAACMITVCAAGWLAYRDMERFSGEKTHGFNDERHRFIAGIDSQNYAPHIKCPVLLLSAINDKKSNYDRFYDTFQQVNPAVDKAILYSSHGNGLIGGHSLTNLDLFLDKYLKGRTVYLSKPVQVSAFCDEENNLNVKIEYDNAGEPEECGIFYTEKINESKARDWTRILVNPKNAREDAVTFPVEVYEGSEKALMYAFVRYSNGFSVTSKIKEVPLTHNPYANSCGKSRVLYAGGGSGFSVFRDRAGSVADCFAVSESRDMELATGYGGIAGALVRAGLVSYRISEPRYEPPRGASIAFDAWCAKDGTLEMRFYCDEYEKEGYSARVKVEGGGKWKKFILEASDFKSETHLSLDSFSDAVSMALFSDEDVIVNNVIWL